MKKGGDKSVYTVSGIGAEEKLIFTERCVEMYSTNIDKGKKVVRKQDARKEYTK